jgi:hypothetical protein
MPVPATVERMLQSPRELLILLREEDLPRKG